MLGHCLEHYRWYYNSKENRITSSMLHFKLLGWVFSARILKILSETKPHSAKSCMKHYHHWKNYSCLLREENGFRSTAEKIEKRAWRECEGESWRSRGGWWGDVLGDVLIRDIVGRITVNIIREQIVIKWLRMSLRE